MTPEQNKELYNYWVKRKNEINNALKPYIRRKKEQTTMTTENQNTEVLGEETLNTSTMETKEIPLIPAGKYPVNFKGASVHCGKEWNSVPNISLQHQMTGESKRVVFSDLLLSTAPDKNGQKHYERKNGLKAFLKILGTDIEQLRVLKKEVVNPENNETVTLKFIDAKQVMDVIEQYKGTNYQVRVNVKPANGQWAAKNGVFEFFPAE